MENEEELLKNCAFGTQAVKGTKVEYPVPSLAIPIFATSTYVLDSASHGAKLTNRDEIPEGTSKWLYTRWDNPTVEAAERLITRLEGGKKTYLYGSGMGAISTLFFSLVKAGQHVIVQLPVYAGTQEVVHLLQKNYNVEATFIPLSSDFTEKVRAAIKDNTVLLYGETPSNPTMDILDIDSFASLGREKKIITVVDSTFASPVNQLPLSYGIDVVVHSCTKYYGGHSDLTAGSLTTVNEEIANSFWKSRKLFGACLSPFEAQLLVRGIKTMEIRVIKQNESALKIANWLEKHPKINKVFYPGLESHPGHSIASKQMKGFGGMIAFEVIGGEEGGRTLIENVKIINLAVSLGGIESLIEHAASMTHAMIDPIVRRESGISDGLIRFSVGIEDVDDLIADLDQALSLISLQ